MRKLLFNNRFHRPVAKRGFSKQASIACGEFIHFNDTKLETAPLPCDREAVVVNVSYDDTLNKRKDSCVQS